MREARGRRRGQERSGVFRRLSDTHKRPDDTVVVPLNAERMAPLPLRQALTSAAVPCFVAARS